MSLKLLFLLLIAALLAAGFYIIYLESKITKLKSEVLGLMLELDSLKKEMNLKLKK